MRQLTIQRTKCFTGCLGTAKVYLEDQRQFETTIAGVPCRKIGVLKNGETGSFEVPNEAVKVFVIADLMSKEFANDFYQLEAGEEPVFLTGAFRYAPQKGNAFRFDNNSNAEALENRQKGGKKFLWILVIAALIGAVLGFIKGSGILTAEQDKLFTHEAFSITLTNGFRESEYEGFEACYDSANVAVMFLKEGFADYEGLEELSTEEYGELMIEYYEMEDTLETGDGIVFLSYKDSVDGVEYLYQAYIFKTSEAFWTVTFATDTADAQEYAEKIETWANSVSFNDAM